MLRGRAGRPGRREARRPGGPEAGEAARRGARAWPRAGAGGACAGRGRGRRWRWRRPLRRRPTGGSARDAEALRTRAGCSPLLRRPAPRPALAPPLTARAMGAVHLPARARPAPRRTRSGPVRGPAPLRQRRARGRAERAGAGRQEGRPQRVPQQPFVWAAPPPPRSQVLRPGGPSRRPTGRLPPREDDTPPTRAAPVAPPSRERRCSRGRPAHNRGARTPGTPSPLGAPLPPSGDSVCALWSPTNPQRPGALGQGRQPPYTITSSPQSLHKHAAESPGLGSPGGRQGQGQPGTNARGHRSLQGVRAGWGVRGSAAWAGARQCGAMSDREATESRALEGETPLGKGVWGRGVVAGQHSKL